jgi:hypothetical protein
MKRKLIITESQYIKLQEFLFETTDVNHTLDFVKAGDDLLFKGPYNVKINIVNVDQNTGEILATTDKNEKIKFYFNSYDDKTKNFNFQKLDKTSNKYVNQPFEVKELDILRNGKVVPISDAGNKQTPTTPTKPKPDDVSKTVELDPTISTNPEAIKSAGEEARKKIDYSKDPLLKKAFHRQAGFWDQFRAELAGKSSESDGIKSVLNMLGKYTNKKVKDKFGDTFTYNKRAKFKIISRTQLGDNTKTYEYLVRSWTEGDADTITLSEPNNPTGLKLIVNERKKNENDVYECTLKAIINGIEQEENIEVRFEKSAGYEPPITGKEPIKNPNK